MKHRILKDAIVTELETLVFEKLKGKLQEKPVIYAIIKVTGYAKITYVEETITLFFRDKLREITLPKDWRTDLNKTVTYIYSTCFTLRLNPNIFGN